MCGNACTVTIPSHFVCESLDPSRWAGLEYQVTPTVLKAGTRRVGTVPFPLPACCSSGLRGMRNGKRHGDRPLRLEHLVV
ncbi:MAG: hypothetical protein COZ05_12735 [Armatimonadetes bacterium CG_4_10_14_3_um_filter_59_10]|nr:MAG: hypothetical protein COZ56_08685 [Armatimonadetes bacterium CG_4_8_14_3_um_filter_58_9]PIY42850.1 MAG: hypothetical protein COZ05_12735 [Armatimonadetes bacterium CG_4_10_14_3_um_filter_59_10]PJB78695.1 MAG: hypothetical protein CO095_00225 [Armatimonadetes bacterium CG_4_9_14_3_um_filter_58_7]